jgi:hypothetical protein
MAGYPVHRPADARRHALGVERPYVDPLDRTSGVSSDGFMNMSPASTSGRQPLAWTFAVTQSEHPAGRDNRTFDA